MDGLMPFFIFYFAVILQRLVELAIANRNEKWMKQKGAVEFGKGHYQVMVILHILFFVSLVLEKLGWNRSFSALWPYLLLVFLFAQFIRGWAINSLGRFWNTKIIVLQDAKLVKKGPYRYIKHPNYLIVAIEFIVIPLMFNCYFTAILFSLLNGAVLMIRIPMEERALRNYTEYDSTFNGYNRFLPKLLK